MYRKKVGFAFPFRYLMFFKYKKIVSFINKNKNILEKYNINIEESITFLKLYKKFNYYFDIYILIKFLKNNEK